MPPARYGWAVFVLLNVEALCLLEMNGTLCYTDKIIFRQRILGGEKLYSVQIWEAAHV